MGKKKDGVTVGASEVRGEGREVRMYAFVAKIAALHWVRPGALPPETFFFRARV
jgi:hypothetical protein